MENLLKHQHREDSYREDRKRPMNNINFNWRFSSIIERKISSDFWTLLKWITTIPIVIQSVSYSSHSNPSAPFPHPYLDYCGYIQTELESYPPTRPRVVPLIRWQGPGPDTRHIDDDGDKWVELQNQKSFSELISLAKHWMVVGNFWSPKCGRTTFANYTNWIFTWWFISTMLVGGRWVIEKFQAPTIKI